MRVDKVHVMGVIPLHYPRLAVIKFCQLSQKMSMVNKLREGQHING